MIEFQLDVTSGVATYLQLAVGLLAPSVGGSG
jgi:hypothetical protein